MSSQTRIVAAILAVSLTLPGVAQDKAASKTALDRAAELLRAKDNKGAESAAKEAIEADPDNLEAHEPFFHQLWKYLQHLFLDRGHTQVTGAADADDQGGSKLCNRTGWSLHRFPLYTESDEC